MSPETAVVPFGEQRIMRNPKAVVDEAREAATALQAVIDGKPRKVEINDKTYLEFSDWQLLGRFYGFTAKVVETSIADIPGATDDVIGYQAKAVALDRDGNEVSAAESMCLNTEARWSDRDLFQIRSMAQTRACAKALRNVLGWVAVLAGYSDTPAEEMTGTEGAKAQQSSKVRQDGVTTVKDITIVKRSKADAKRAWVLYNVKFADGRSAKCFGDNATFVKAKALEISKTDCVPDIQPDEHGGNNLADFKPLPGAPAEAKAENGGTVQRDSDTPMEPGTDEMAVVETILSARDAAGDLGAEGWKVIQGSERIYVCKDTAVLAVIGTLQRDKLKVVAKWEAITLGGRRCRRVIAFDDPPEAK